ncbi:MAG: hypothetical protein M1823_003519 [Watsoniomyces obsoletus]|nr:MAG: hypothetical protein M1823_003519 [Watsoniomyces obsoletus]
MNGVSDRTATPSEDGLVNGSFATRRSGRVVRKPQFLVPESQEPNSRGGGKRKRSEQIEGDDDDENHGSDEGSSLTSAPESDDEADLKDINWKGGNTKKTPKVPKAKKAKTGTLKTSTLPLRTKTKKPAARTARAAPRASNASRTSDGLYDKVFTNKADVDGLAEEWVSRYDRNHTEATRDLVNLVLNASGCELEVTVHDIEDQDNVTGKLGDLQDEYQTQKVTEYPLISRTKRKPPFRATLEHFFRGVIEAAHASSTLYKDSTFIENIQLWIATMSSSSIRPFRHTATFILLTIMSALCETAAEMTENLATTSRQLEGEKKKARRNKERVAALEKKVSEGNDKYESLENVIRDIFDTVFVHRYRDVDPKIRVECVQALGHWILTLPDVFFDGSYLRYLGWVLSDTYAPTRLEVLKQLNTLYQKKENVGGLRTFTERFRPRIVEMATRDVDLTVRPLAVELLGVIRSVGLLEPDDIDAVGKLIFDAEVRVRKAVVEFFVENVDDLYQAKLEELGGEEAFEDEQDEDDIEATNNPKLSWLKLKCLAEMLEAYDAQDEDASNGVDDATKNATDALNVREPESCFSLATKAFYEFIPEVRDWEVLTSYLLHDHSEGVTHASISGSREALKEVCRLSDREEIILLEVLNAAVRVRLAEFDPKDAENKKTKTKKTAKASSEAQETTALQLARLIPQLLSKFGAIPAAASAVLRLEHVLNLDIFQQLRQDSTTFPALLDDINKQFVSHSHQSVLAEASAALLHALSYEDLHEVTESKLQRLWDDTISSLCRSGADVRPDSEPVTTDVAREVADTMRRLSSLAAISDCVDALEQSPSALAAGTKPPLQLLLGLLPSGLPAEPDDEDLPAINDELVLSTMKSLLFYFMWKLRRLQQSVTDGRFVHQPDIDHLREHRDEYVSRLGQLIRDRSGADPLRISATGFFLDVHTLFATVRQLAGKSSDVTPAETECIERIRSLALVMSPENQKLVISVYTAAEKGFAKKSGRKVEPAEDDAPTDDELESESEDDDDDDDEDKGAGTRQREKRGLVFEQRLCEITGKIVLAILAGVLDATGPQKGKIKERITRNRARLGRNFKEVVAYLDEPKSKRAARKPVGAKTKKAGKQAKSTERVASEDTAAQDEDEEEDEEAHEEVEEGGEEDLRNRELVADDDNIDDEDHESHRDEAGHSNAEEEDGILGD